MQSALLRVIRQRNFIALFFLWGYSGWIIELDFCLVKKRTSSLAFWLRSSPIACCGRWSFLLSNGPSFSTDFVITLKTTKLYNINNLMFFNIQVSSTDFSSRFSISLIACYLTVSLAFTSFHISFSAAEKLSKHDFPSQSLEKYMERCVQLNE